jgi:Phage tail protein
VAYSLTYSVGGTVYTLSGYDATTGLTINYLGDQGFGMAPMHRITQRGPLQQGDSDIDFRLDPRIIQLPLYVDALTIGDHYNARAKLMQIFTPTNAVGTLTVTADSFVRSIDVEVLGGLDMNVDAKAGYGVRTVVQLRAADPTWYDPTPQVITLTPSIAGTAFAIPMAIPLTMGTASINSTTTVSYDGTWLSYPIITAVGPITGLSITNNTTGDVISLGAVAIGAGTTYIFDLRYGYKTVKTTAGVNKIADVTAASNLATFAIVPAPTATGGVNSITVTSSSSSSPAEVSLTYYTRFVGI